MSLRNRLRRLAHDLTNPYEGNIGVTELEPTPDQKAGYKLTVIPMVAAIIVFVHTGSWLYMLATTVVVAAAVNIARRIYRGAYAQ